jgi:hypothetical protein
MLPVARDRPSTRHLTEFYLLMSVGGMLGGMFNGLLAPIIFPGVWEFPIAIFVAGLVRPAMAEHGWLDRLLAGVLGEGERRGRGRHAGPEPTTGMTVGLDFGLPIAVLLLTLLTQGIFMSTSRLNTGTAQPELAYGIPLVVTLLFLMRPLRFGLALGAVLLLIDQSASGGRETLLRERSYFGILHVRLGTDYYLTTAGDKDGQGRREYFEYRNLTHGTTDHGQNFIKPSEDAKNTQDLSRLTTTYYHRAGPAGMAMEKFDWFFKMSKNNPKASEADIAANWNKYHSDARMPVSLIGQAAMPIPGGLGTLVSQGNLLVDAWSEPAYCTIGLGTGTMASYARPFQILHFYEIDSRVRRYSLPEEEIAKGDRLESYRISLSADAPKNFFTYLRDARRRGAGVDILMGDARLRMDQPWLAEDQKGKQPWEIPWDRRGGPDSFYHLIVVDAFSSDAIPVHLLTKEAVEMYMKKLRPDGVLCVHVSNRHLELVPVVADIAGAIRLPMVNPDTLEPLLDEKGQPKLGPLHAKRGRDNNPGGRDPSLGGGLRRREHLGHTTSEWVMVARDKRFLEHLVEPVDYEPLRELNNAERRRHNLVPDTTPYWNYLTSTPRHVWTDDYSNLMSVFRWPWRRGRAED